MHRQRTAPGIARRLLLLAAVLGIASADPARGQCSGCANASFGPAIQRFGLEAGGNYFAIADFNQDGFLDVAAPGNTNGGGVTIHFGDGRGGFGSAADVGVGQVTSASTVVSGDLNGDGLPDLLVGDGLSVFLADGQGGFQLVYQDFQFGPLLGVADLNGDGRLDAIGSLGYFPGNGDGTFGAPVALPGGPYYSLLTIADFNGDGLPDLAISNGDAVILLADGLGGFSIAATFSNPDGTIPSGASGDFNGDGHADLAVLNGNFFSPATIGIFLGDGTGSFTPATSLAGPSVFNALLVVADFDGDGIQDILLGSGFVMYPGLGGGEFGTPIPLGLAAAAIGVADFTGDGKPDVALTLYPQLGISVAVNDGFGGFPTAASYALASAPAGAASAALTAGGHQDLIVASPNGGVLLVLPGAGDGTFGQTVTVPLDLPPAALTVADFNHDGHPDVAVTNDSGVAVLLGDGSGHLGTPAQFAGGYSGVVSGYLNGDGNADLVTSSAFEVEVLLGDGAGGFADPVPIEVTGLLQGGSVVLADVNGDGHLDILAAAGSVVVLLGNGDGTFGPPISTTTVDGVGQLVAGDWNGDGHTDIAVNANGGNSVLILLGDGTGQFGPPTEIPLPGSNGLTSLTVGDFNADGHQDIVVANPGSQEIDFLMGDGTGGFAPPSRWSAQDFGAYAVVGDWNEDGRPDLATFGANATILINTNCSVRRLGVSTNVSTCNTAGAAFPVQPVIGVYDDGGNVVGCAGGTVAASLVPESGAPGAALGGTTTVAVASGLATFADLSLDLDATGYVLQFTHPVAGATRSRAFTVGVAPPAPVATNSGPYCPGQALSLYATTVPGAVYRWTGPNGFSATIQSPVIPGASPDAAGVYAVTAIVNGCTSSSAETTVGMLAPPAGPAVVGYGKVCSGSRLMLRVTDAAFAYHWFHDGVLIPDATGPIYTVAAAGFTDAGAYTVSTSDETGCTSLHSAPVAVTITFCYAEADALAADPSGNGIIEPGELALVVPTWLNRNIAPLTLAGTATNLTGPAGATYTLSASAAGYGTIPAKTTADCLTATGNCYAVTATASGARPATHWDAFLDETLDDSDPPRTWTLHIGGSFTDVPSSSPFYASIETALHNGITSGCSPTEYCPGNGVTRAQMAVLLLRARLGAAYVPPPATGEVFSDVPADAFAAAWIEELFHENITAGCGNGAYCPSVIVNRAQMAVFLLRAKFGNGYGVPACAGIFADVACPGDFADWIEALYNEGITGGCGTDPLLFCPNQPNTRGQMAVFLTKAFSLGLYGP